jgi:Na+(H+)/acetate symporter ActP
MPMRLVALAVVVLVAGFVPLIIVGLMDREANPIGLGLLSVLGTLVAALLLAFAALRGLWRRLRRG